MGKINQKAFKTIKDYHMKYSQYFIFTSLIIISFCLTYPAGVKLIGVAPENEIQYPKVNSTFNDPSEIA